LGRGQEPAKRSGQILSEYGKKSKARAAIALKKDGNDEGRKPGFMAACLDFEGQIFPLTVLAKILF